MRWFVSFSLTFLILTGVLFFLIKNKTIISPLAPKNEKKEKALMQYTFNNLSKKTFEPSPIVLGREITTNERFISQMFYYTVDGKKVSGLANIPLKPGIYPVIVMYRGF